MESKGGEESREEARRKCCKRKTDPNHRCRSGSNKNRIIGGGGSGGGMASLTEASTTGTNLSRALDNGVRGRLSAVEQMLREVRNEVIDKVKRETEARDKKSALQRSASTPEKKLLRFEDDARRGEDRDKEDDDENNRRFIGRSSSKGRNNNRGIDGRKLGPKVEALRRTEPEGRGRDGQKMTKTNPSLKYKARNGNNNSNYDCHYGCKEEKNEIVYGEREMEEEFKRLEVIKSGVADMKRRHVNQSLTLRETQEQLRRALERLQRR